MIISPTDAKFAAEYFIKYFESIWTQLIVFTVSYCG